MNSEYIAVKVTLINENNKKIYRLAIFKKDSPIYECLLQLNREGYSLVNLETIKDVEYLNKIITDFKNNIYHEDRSLGYYDGVRWCEIVEDNYA